MPRPSSEIFLMKVEACGRKFKGVHYQKFSNLVKKNFYLIGSIKHAVKNNATKVRDRQQNF